VERAARRRRLRHLLRVMNQSPPRLSRPSPQPPPVPRGHSRAGA
jgi:hypothetical protein